MIVLKKGTSLDTIRNPFIVVKRLIQVFTVPMKSKDFELERVVGSERRRRRSG